MFVAVLEAGGDDPFYTLSLTTEALQRMPFFRPDHTFGTGFPMQFYDLFIQDLIRHLQLYFEPVGRPLQGRRFGLSQWVGTAAISLPEKQAVRGPGRTTLIILSSARQ